MWGAADLICMVMEMAGSGLRKYRLRGRSTNRLREVEVPDRHPELLRWAVPGVITVMPPRYPGRATYPEAVYATMTLAVAKTCGLYSFKLIFNWLLPTLGILRAFKAEYCYPMRRQSHEHGKTAIPVTTEQDMMYTNEHIQELV
ncbi:hypothetical protein LIA77_04190 [Sarocladium implicatum]|nr:hypothetical protein LIA77_04190 [Sarocladium implicatum]